MKITEQVWQFSQPIVESLGCKLWDVEYVREGGEWYLRLYLDKDGGVDINDCEAVSRAVDPVLDEKDPIPESYHFEVCSAGLERPLKRPSKQGRKELHGTLPGYDNGRVTIEAAGETLTFEKQEVALVRLYVEF